MDDTVSEFERERSREFRVLAERLRDFAAIGPHWFWETDADLRYTFVSDGVVDVLGIPPETMKGTRRGELARGRFAAGSSEIIDRHVAELKSHKPFRDYHFPALHPKGYLVHVLSSGNPFFGPDGRFLGYRGVSTDYSQTATAEAKMRESEQRFRDFALASSDRMWETDEDHRYTYLSPTPEEGERTERLIGTQRWESEPVDDPALWAPYKQAVTAQRPIRGFTYPRRTADGRVAWIRTSGSPIFHPDGRFRGYRGVNLDITDYIEARHAAEVAEDRLRAAIESLDDAFAYFDADERFVLCNSKFLEYYTDVANILAPGVSFEDIVRNGVTHGYIQQSDSQTESYVTERMRRFREASGTFEQELAGGRWLRVMDRRTPDGGTVAFRVDISELKTRELALSRARELASAESRAKTEFLSSLSHELRTPMNAILGFSQLLEQASSTLSPAQIVDYARHIVQSGQHLTLLVNQVLELSKVESGHAALTFESVSVPALVRECLDMVRNSAAAARVSLIDETENRELPQLSTDAGRFRQVMLNLLSNAVKYNRTGGSVTVTAGRSGTRWLRINVVDTGHGIDAARQSEVFQPFNRLGRESSGIEGTGIGLFLTRRIVEQLGGAIGFTSAPGEGTTFWVEFPVSGEAEKAVPDARPPTRAVQRMPASGGTHTVLYVEDNAVNLRLMSEIFTQMAQVRLITATTAEQGLELVALERPDLVILDINLPGMDGFEALQRLLADPETAQIPVIALTAMASPEDASRGLAAGFREYLTKPVNVAQIIESVERQLSLQ